jgi:hypothetical protein
MINYIFRRVKIYSSMNRTDYKSRAKKRRLQIATNIRTEEDVDLIIQF